jgi:hypothetical protein
MIIFLLFFYILIILIFLLLVFNFFINFNESYQPDQSDYSSCSYKLLTRGDEISYFVPILPAFAPY